MENDQVSMTYKRALFTMGICPTVRGANYLCYILENKLYEKSNREIYEKVGEKFGISEDAVQKAVENCMRNSYKNPNKKETVNYYMRKLTGINSIPQTRHLTNKEIFSYLCFVRDAVDTAEENSTGPFENGENNF